MTATRPRVMIAALVGALALCLFTIVIGVLLVSGAAVEQCDPSVGAADFSGPGSLGGLAGTGLSVAQIQSVRSDSPFAGTRVTAGTYLTTAYGPPWGGIQGAGLSTSGGLWIDGGAPRWYVIAVDPRLIAHGTLVDIWPNPFGWHGAFLAADTGGDIQGRRIDFYDWRGRVTQYRWGERQATAHRDDASPENTPLTPPSDCSTSTPAAGAAGSLGLPGTRGHVTVGPLANAPGKPIQPQLIAYAEVVAGIAGRDLIITTGTNHSELTVSGNVSDHVEGLAADFGSVANHFPIGGGFGTTLAAAGLRAAGVDGASALRIAAAGGGHNVCHAGWRVQVIWRTTGHYDHVHIGLKHGCDFIGVQTFQL